MEGEGKSEKNENSSTVMKRLEQMVASEDMSQSVLEESHTCFTRQIDNFYCDFSLTKQGSLKIVLNSVLDASISSLELTSQQKKSQQDLNFFESIQQIYEYLQDNTEDSDKKISEEERLVRIDEKGKVLMTVVSTIGKKERKKEIVLATSKVEENREVYLQKLIKRISKNMLELRSEVRELKEKQESFEGKNQQFLQKIKAQGQRLVFRWSKSDPHLQKFKIAEKRVTKVLDDTSYFSIISEHAVNKTGVSYFRVKVINSAQKNIIVGIGSKFIRGISNAYTHPDFIGFYPYGQGYIWQKTNQRQLHLRGMPIENGVVITTIIDMDLGFVGWQICGVRVAYAVLPLELKAKMLLPTIMMVNVNDCLQLL